MILCSCNRISDKDIRGARKSCGAPAQNARDVFRAKNCAPKCGRCVRNIQDHCARQDFSRDRVLAAE